MVVSKTFIVTCGLLVFLLLAEGCTHIKKKKRSTLHNYPMFKDMECPIDMDNYDEEYVEKRAAELNMRPVDYLHRYNKMRYRPVNKNRNVGITKNKEKQK